jgi:nucleotide-binding universal stress UspA family protein
MKILATFDGTPFAESTVPVLQRMSALPGADFVLLAVADEPSGRLQQRGVRRRVVGAGADPFATGTPFMVDAGEPRYAESKDQAIDRKRHELENYLADVAKRIGGASTIAVEAHISNDAAQLIIDVAKEEHPDVIVMATHSRTGLLHVIFGSTTEKVVRSGVAPVLVVHPIGDAQA